MPDLLLKMVATYVPETQTKLTEGAYTVAAKGFVAQPAKDHWTLTTGDDVIGRAAAGRFVELAQELRGAVLPIADAECDARRESTRAGKPQETTTVGKLTVASDDDQEKPEARSRGAFREDGHELAHGAFAP